MASGAYTGYIHQLLDDNQTFNEFVWSNARAFGALATMRDLPQGAPVPEEFEADPYYAQNFKEAEEELSAWQAMTPGQKMAWADSERDQQISQAVKSESARLIESGKLSSMLHTVIHWMPPTPGHAELKAHMLNQLRSALSDAASDYFTRQVERAQQLTIEDLVQEREDRLARDVTYARDALKKNLDGTALRNQWIKTLRESVPDPAKQVAAS